MGADLQQFHRELGLGAAVAWASQNFATGQTRHRGLRGRQTVAPSSIIGLIESRGMRRIQQVLSDLLEAGTRWIRSRYRPGRL